MIVWRAGRWLRPSIWQGVWKSLACPDQQTSSQVIDRLTFRSHSLGNIQPGVIWMFEFFFGTKQQIEDLNTLGKRTRVRPFYEWDGTYQENKLKCQINACAVSWENVAFLPLYAFVPLSATLAKLPNPSLIPLSLRRLSPPLIRNHIAPQLLLLPVYVCGRLCGRMWSARSLRLLAWHNTESEAMHNWHWKTSQSILTSNFDNTKSTNQLIKDVFLHTLLDASNVIFCDVFFSFVFNYI